VVSNAELGHCVNMRGFEFGEVPGTAYRDHAYIELTPSHA